MRDCVSSGLSARSNSLLNPDVKGFKLIGRYGANAQDTLFYILDTDDVNAIQKFLWPGFQRCAITLRL